MADETMLIEGYAIVFNQKTILFESDGIKFYEIVNPSALRGADMTDVLLKYNHSDEVFVLAGVKNGSLQLIQDAKGLKIRAELANTTAGRDLYELIRTRLLDKMSFAFTIDKDEYDQKTRTRTIKSIKKLWDCAVVSVPAYPQTSVSTINDEFRTKEFYSTKLRMAKDRVLSMVHEEQKEIEIQKAKEAYRKVQAQQIKEDINKTLKSGR